jgi:hypothetical protein
MVEQTQKALKQEKPTSSFLGSKLDHAQAAVVPTWLGLGFAKKNPLLPSAVLSIGKSIFFKPCPIARTLPKDEQKLASQSRIAMTASLS